VPVSGVLKSSFTHPQLSPRVFAHFSVLKVGATLSAVAAAILYLIWFFSSRWAGVPTGRTDERELYNAALAVMAAALLVHFPYSMLFVRWAEAWHFVPYGLFLSLAAGPLAEVALRRFTRPVRRRVYVSGAVALLVLGSLAVADRATRPLASSWFVVSYEAAVWAREHTGEHDIFCMANAGHFGYFSGRRVISLDGIVGTLGFQETLREGKLNEFLSDHEVSYLVEHTFSDRKDNDAIVSGGYGRVVLPFRSLLYEATADEVSVREEDEVYRSAPYRERGRGTILIIWRLRHDGHGVPDEGATGVG